jgi:hypothetical protein
VHIAIDLPEDIAQRLQAAWHDVSRRTLEAVVVEGYRDGTLTRDLVGQVLGLSFWEAESFLKHVPTVFRTLQLDDDEVGVSVDAEEIDASFRVLPVTELLADDHDVGRDNVHTLAQEPLPIAAFAQTVIREGRLLERERLS